jgi:DNA-binding IclR family transcriptional regulator
MSRTATRAFDLFETIVRSPVPMGLMDVVEATDIDKSTAQRLLGFLVERELLTRDPAKRYLLGPAAFAMSAAISARSDLRGIIAPAMRQLRDSSGETVSVHLAVGNRRVCVDGLESTDVIRRVVPIGDSLPLHLGPSGKAILAYLPEPRIDDVFTEADVKRLDRKEIRDDLARVREQGYLLTESDRSPGVRAISAPIFDSHGVTASFTVAGPSERFTTAGAEALRPLLLAATADISRTLGGHRP